MFERKKMIGGRPILLAALLLVLGVFGLGVTVNAADAQPDGSGGVEVTTEKSITVSLVADGSAIGNVAIDLYKVGNLSDSGLFVLDAAYAGIPSDLNQLTTAEETLVAAHELLSIARGMKGETGEEIYPVETGYTDFDGNLVFSGLENGIYLIAQDTTDTSSYYIDGEEHDDPDNVFMSPYLIAVGSTTQFELSARPKISITDERGSLEVTKLLHLSQDNGMVTIGAADQTFYVGLFYDPQGFSPVGEDYLRAIHIQNAVSGSVVFENLPPGTYYVLEVLDGVPVPAATKTVDAAGNAFTSFVKSADSYGKVEVDLSNSALAIGADIDNVFYDLPDGYFLSGFLHLRKEVYEGTERITVPEEFYASISYVESNEPGGQETLFTVVSLIQNESVSVEVPLIGEGTGAHTLYHVQEVVPDPDNEGSYLPVDDGFSYYVNITGDGYADLTYDENNPMAINAALTIKNTKKEPSPTPGGGTTTPTITPDLPEGYGPDPSTTPVPGGSNRTSTTTHTDSTVTVNHETQTQTTDTIKTGDDTPIALYVSLLALAGLGILLLVVRRRKK